MSPAGSHRTTSDYGCLPCPAADRPFLVGAASTPFAALRWLIPDRMRTVTAMFCRRDGWRISAAGSQASPQDIGILTSRGRNSLAFHHPEKVVMDQIFASHLFFIRRHRGDFAVGTHSVIVASEAPGFTSWVLVDSAARRPPEMDAVRLIPASGDTSPQKFEREGFRAAEQLSYQEFKLSGAVQEQSGPALRHRPCRYGGRRARLRQGSSKMVNGRLVERFLPVRCVRNISDGRGHACKCQQDVHSRAVQEGGAPGRRASSLSHSGSRLFESRSSRRCGRTAHRRHVAARLAGGRFRRRIE